MVGGNLAAMSALQLPDAVVTGAVDVRQRRFFS